MSSGNLPLGSIPHGWELEAMRDVTDKIGSGATPRGGKQVYQSTGTAFIRSQNVHDHRFEWGGLARITDDAAEALRGVTVKPGDVLLNITGDSILRTCMVPEDVLPARVSQHVAIVRTNGRLDARLIHAYLSIPQVKRRLLGNSAGGTRKAVTKAHIENLPIPVPPSEVQAAIAEVLEAIDDRIASGHRLRELLTAFSQVLVDDLLSRSGEPSATLGEVLDVIETGGRPRGGVTGIVEGIPSIGAESVTEAGDFDFGRTKRVPVDYFEGMSRGKLEDGDVLLYKDGGRPGQFEPHVSMIGEGFPFTVAAINEHVYRLRVGPPYSQAFLYFWLRSRGTMEEMRRRGTGVAIPGLNSTNVKGLPFPSIEPRDLAQTRAVIDVTVARILQLACEARTLSTFRDTITPELLSGRKRLGAHHEHSGAQQ